MMYFKCIIPSEYLSTIMNRTLSNKISLLLIIALVMTPLQMAFASGSINFNHPISCHSIKTVNQVHTGHHKDMLDHGAEQMQMMVDCEHATGMQHNADTSCQADAQSSGAAAFIANPVVAIPTQKTYFLYHISMTNHIVSLFEKPPQLPI